MRGGGICIICSYGGDLIQPTKWPITISRFTYDTGLITLVYREYFGAVDACRLAIYD